VGQYFVAVDPGQQRDPCAVAVAQVIGDAAPRQYHVSELQRFLRADYTKMGEAIATLMRTPPIAGNGTLLVDATGVGKPFVDILTRQGLYPISILFTAGSEAVKVSASLHHVPKRELVSSTHICLGDGRLQFAETLPLTPVILKELKSFRARISAALHVIFGADWRLKATDDLVCAVSMICWYGEQSGPAAADISSADIARIQRQAGYEPRLGSRGGAPMPWDRRWL